MTVTIAKWTLDEHHPLLQMQRASWTSDVWNSSKAKACGEEPGWG
ncbi:hypothetical protein [Coleofasciculus sp. FACHB-1120]|nr:hypothetical protein [Coleofasciculus sp. FACHB-1120]